MENDNLRNKTKNFFFIFQASGEIKERLSVTSPQNKNPTGKREKKDIYIVE